MIFHTLTEIRFQCLVIAKTGYDPFGATTEEILDRARAYLLFVEDREEIKTVALNKEKAPEEILGA